jgi:hypothetical protein
MLSLFSRAVPLLSNLSVIVFLVTPSLHHDGQLSGVPTGIQSVNGTLFLLEFAAAT